MSERTPLRVAISTDNDKTYPYRKNIAEGPNAFAYPIAIQTSDGLIHVIYTSNRRTVINHAVFDERRHSEVVLPATIQERVGTFFIQNFGCRATAGRWSGAGIAPRG